MERTRDRMYRSARPDLPLARHRRRAVDACTTAIRAARASASEYLDNILTGQLRKRIMPVLEELPLDEKVRRGNVLVKSRPRDVEETLLHLINDDDQVVAAVAIDVVRAAAAVERSPTTSSTCSRYRDAARLVCLRGRVVGARRAADAGGTAARAVARAAAGRGAGRTACGPCRCLRRSASTSCSGLPAPHARSAISPGTLLLQEGSVPETIHVLLDGRVTASGRESAPSTIEAPATLGFVQALQGVAMRRSIRTVEATVTLVLTADELRTLLADNTDLVRGLFSTLAERVDPATFSNVQRDRRGAKAGAHRCRRRAAGGEDPGAAARARL